MGTARAYLRKSGKKDATGTFDVQAATVMRLSEHDEGEPSKLERVATLRDAREHAQWATDWAVSGRADPEARPGYHALLNDIEAGRVSTVYAYAEDRLGRDVEYGARLLKLCDRTGTRIVTPSGVISEPEQRMVAHIRWSMAEEEHRKSTNRNQAKAAREWQRGDDRGEPPYGYVKVRLTEPGVNRRGEPAEAGAMVDRLVDPEAVERVARAFRESGTALGAAKLLNGLGVLSPKDWRRSRAKDPLPVRGDDWTARGVMDVLQHNGIAQRQKGVGRPTLAMRPLSKLITCRCGQVMSPSLRGWTCRLGLASPEHGPYNVSDRIVVEWAMGEAARLTRPYLGTLARTAADRSTEREALIERKRRVGIAYADGNLTDDEYAERVSDADARLAAIAEEEASEDALIPTRIEWDWEPKALNDVLRVLWPGGIKLGLVEGALRPVEAVWRFPDWRAA
jgi:DNA invertase Pin-like site-specific DNA recombinase